VKHLGLILRIIAAVILLQTLFFKFTGAPESIYIFSQLGVEPYGRWFSGLAELAAGILLLISRTQLLGALAAVSIMLGAILSHLLILGIVVQDDGGTLFTLALVVLLSSLSVIYLNRHQLTIAGLKGIIKC
jgi:uncharacterized membrane protein YphA (DoxX/SURF4 family)